MLYLFAASNHLNFHDINAEPTLRCRQRSAEAVLRLYADIKADHTHDHQALFHRVQLDLSGNDHARPSTLDRLLGDDKENDPQLIALYFQFGRYLLIASSRAGSQAANVQGIWNDKMIPPWDSKWTVNINTEMNYWPADLTNLAECYGPLFASLNPAGQGQGLCIFKSNTPIGQFQSQIGHDRAVLGMVNDIVEFRWIVYQIVQFILIPHRVMHIFPIRCAHHFAPTFCFAGLQ